jgi:hypothetical protein
MRPIVKRALVCVGVGVVATVAIAWTAALAMTTRVRHADATGSISKYGEHPDLAFSLIGERRWGIQTYIFSVRENRANNSEGPAWEPFPGPQLGVPIWTMRPEHLDIIKLALAQYPAPINFPPYVGQAQRAAPWPWWLGAIPSSANGLIAYGGRGAGWPFVTMRSLLTVEQSSREGVWSGAVRVRPFALYNRKVQSQDPQSGTVPLLPHPVLFPLSVLMWGGGAFTVWSGAAALRGRARRRRGACAQCGYDLKGTGGTCPECGAGAATA